jgi:hypothetical protein
MKIASLRLLGTLEQQQKTIHTSNESSSLTAEKAIKASIKSFEELKSIFSKYSFVNKEEEIDFFKNLKPQIASKLIYYNEIYNMEVGKPSGSKKSLKKYYEKEQNKLKEFYVENKDFYKYINSGNTSLDKKYFLRRKHDIRLTLDSAYFQSDHTFATSHDFKVAQIIAYKELQKHLDSKLIKQKLSKSRGSDQQKNTSPLKWTASKVALVELMYALHVEGVFNNGNISLNETAKNMESLFNIEIGQFNRIFSEIKNRKTIEPTSFLNNLTQSLSKRIQQSDEL